MSSFPFLGLLLVLGDLLKNTSHLVGCLTLLKESNHPERIGSHHLVQVSKLVLVCLRLVIIPIIQPGYSGYSSTVLPITRLLNPPI